LLALSGFKAKKVTY